MGGLENPTKCEEIWHYVKISQVEHSKDNIAWVLFVLERLINRKLHYRLGVSGYNVLRVIKRFAFKKVYFF